MAIDLFEQLSAGDVPPPPASLDRDVHERLNRRLLAVHLVEFATGAFVHAIVHLIRGMGGWFAFTLSGRYPLDRKSSEGRDRT